jgi:hypothetical protein
MAACSVKREARVASPIDDFSISIEQRFASSALRLKFAISLIP